MAALNKDIDVSDMNITSVMSMLAEALTNEQLEKMPSERRETTPVEKCVKLRIIDGVHRITGLSETDIRQVHVKVYKYVENEEECELAGQGINKC